MNWIEKIQKKSQTEKLRLIWIFAAAVVVLMIGIWAISAKYGRHLKKDTTLFETFGRGIKDVRTNFHK